MNSNLDKIKTFYRWVSKKVPNKGLIAFIGLVSMFGYQTLLSLMAMVVIYHFLKRVEK